MVSRTNVTIEITMRTNRFVSKSNLLIRVLDVILNMKGNFIHIDKLIFHFIPENEKLQ